MAGIPKAYRKLGERAITSYDWFDIAERTGVVLFYGLYR